MKIFYELSLEDFEPWGDAENTKEIILDKGKENEFEYLINELYPEGINETNLNDLLWFEDEWIFESLGIKEVFNCSICGEEFEDEDEALYCCQVDFECANCTHKWLGYDSEFCPKCNSCDIEEE